MPRTVTSAKISLDPQTHEDIHVHAVYDQIASHFSSTRYKPWPIIAAFLSDLPTGWVGLDSGTGNGKYLPLPLDRPGSVWTIGLDRSRNLLAIAQGAGGEEGHMPREVVWGDVLGRGWRPGALDYAISIATIHHLSTKERRMLAVRRLLECVSPQHGRVLIYVWALEQDELSKRMIPHDSTEDGGRAQSLGEDVFVPWVMSNQTAAIREEVAADSPQVYNRYYHMFAKGELRQLVLDAAQDFGLLVGPKCDIATVGNGLEIMQDGWERSNYFVELRLWQR